MKKTIIGIMGFIILIGLFMGIKSKSVQAIGSVEELSKKIIRFHILANSDSKEDQDLKLKVRDEVIEFVSPKLKNSKSIKQSREILMNLKTEVIEVAKKVIKEEGYAYDVDVELAMTNFPVKTYGNITLPQGEYEAFRILIGEAKGQNWWCVMFPPLCFIDVTKGEVEDERSKEELDSKVAESKCENKDSGDIKIKFKIVEIFKNLFG